MNGWMSRAVQDKQINNLNRQINKHVMQWVDRTHDGMSIKMTLEGKKKKKRWTATRQKAGTMASPTTRAKDPGLWAHLENVFELRAREYVKSINLSVCLFIYLLIPVVIRSANHWEVYLVTVRADHGLSAGHRWGRCHPPVSHTAKSPRTMWLQANLWWESTLSFSVHVQTPSSVMTGLF